MNPLITILLSLAPILASFSRSRYLQTGSFLIPLLGVAFTFQMQINLDWWLAPFGWQIGVTPMSLFLARILTVLTFLVAIYSGPFQTKDNSGYFTWLGIFQTSCLAVLFSADYLNFFIFWELVALSIYYLIRPNQPDVARRYFVIQFAGATILFAGMMLQIAQTSSTTITAAQPNLQLLFIVGLGVKAALLGLHFWLPDAHTKAPTPVSALLSGFTVKLGIYGMLNMTPGISFLLFTGVLMAIYGGIYALIQHDAKTILAYSTVSQLGYIISAVGAGAASAALSHSLSHALFKSLLFLAVGAVGYRLGTRDLLKMGGMTKTMPLTTLAATVAGLAIMGFPPLNGFASKQLIKDALAIQPGLPLLLSLADYLTVVYIAKLLYYGFYRKPEHMPLPTHQGAGKSPKFPSRYNVTEAPLAMVIPMLGLAFLCLYTGLFPIPTLTVAATPLKAFTSGKVMDSLMTIVLGILIFIGARPILRPTPKDFNDMDYFYGLLVTGLEYLRKGFQNLHTGNLNHYLLWYMAFIVLTALYFLGENLL